MGLDAQNLAAEVKIRAEHGGGELLKSNPEFGKGRKCVTTTHLGIDPNDSRRWQAIARIPEDEFEKHIADTTSANRELTTAGQKALVAADALPLFEKEAKKRQRAHGGTAPGKKNTQRNNALSDSSKASADAAKAFNVSPRYVEAAKDIKKKSPKLAEQARPMRFWCSSRAFSVAFGGFVVAVEVGDAVPAASWCLARFHSSSS